ncbi:tartrate dehydratase [Thermotoga sp. KOL6]|uniref:tartrate dehydratase n=1 Tax=Thermotoga sp. KOL6 TaxID=126741 RepID=UPI000C75D987|nr:tartrate dehydratase [Thermotoga sp. KOL6]PLV59384.1 tartrate dehydratase [Thermotoga sp. KOL6]
MIFLKIVLRYPVSLSVIRKLESGDLVYYTGKIVTMDKEIVEIIEKYERSEGTRLYDLTGEIVALGVFEKNRFRFQEIDEELLEKLFLMGVSGVIVNQRVSFSVTKRFSRVLFEAVEEIKGSRKVVYKTPDGRKLEEVEVEKLAIRVIQDSSGKTYVKV